MEQGFYNNQTVTTLGEDTQHIVTVDKVQANVYFDGTLNNYYNVEQASDAIRRQYGGGETSYDNGLSNVARMWKTIGKEKDGPDIGVYIEGMGTTKFEKDDITGFALGEGRTGIRARAQSAFAPLLEKVKKSRKENGPPALLELNVFGFSRGAATARHFVHLLRNADEINKHFVDEWRFVHVLVNFVGLFDTVSSEGTYYGNDVNDLGLRFTPDAAKHVFHLVALDEYRANFSDTTITSACQAHVIIGNDYFPMGFELGIPGAHSDVGGGYVCDIGRPEREQRHLAPSQSNEHGDRNGPQAFAYQQGWYLPSDQQTTPLHPYSHQRMITGDYYRVALSLMVDMAEKHTVTIYQDKLDVTAQTPEIAKIQTALRAQVQENAFIPGKPTRMNWELDAQLGTEAAKAFRHAYLHLSASDKFGMEPRYQNATTWKRHHEAG